MTLDQLPAGLPMDDKIEAWVQRALDLAHDGLFFALDDHLRTTPEGFVLVPVEPTEAMIKASMPHALGDHAASYKAMLAASQESAALKEQSK